MGIENIKVMALVHRAIDSGATYIRAEFSGSGDDGDIDDLVMTEGNDWNAKEVGHINDAEALKEFLYHKVSDTVGLHGDWVNNEGGYGTLWWNLLDNKFNIDYVQRTTVDVEIPEQTMFE